MFFRKNKKQEEMKNENPSNHDQDLNKENQDLNQEETDMKEEVNKQENSEKNETWEQDPGPENIEVNERTDKTQPVNTEEKHKADVEALNDKYLRLYSEFDNYKRRTNKERMDLLKTAHQEVVVALLPVLDDFERALKSIENSGESPLKDGVLLIQNKLQNILRQKGLKEMESMGKSFNTDEHEAITKIPAPSDEMKGKVIDVVEKGYTLNEKVIRYAKVVVGE